MLSANEGSNTLHGGKDGFDKRFWNSNGVEQNNTKIVFSLVSEDGDQGFPGEVNVSVTYTLTDNDELKINYHATSDKPTPINLCNHAYFTLGESHVKDMHIRLPADAFLPTKADGIPTGHFEPVKNTKFDLNILTDLEKQLDEDGFDHCFKILENQTALVIAKNTGICLEIETNNPAIQLYTGNFLPIRQTALCLEAQGFNDAINQDAFPADILRPNETYSREVIYRYSLSQAS